MTEVSGTTGSARGSRSEIGYRLGAMALELAVLAAVWWILKLKLPLVGAIAVVIVVSNLVPERFGTLTLGVMLLGLAAFMLGYYNAQQMAMVVAIFGVIAVVGGVVSLRRPGGRG